MKNIDPLNLQLAVSRALLQDWMLLSSGDFHAGRFNAMTVGWGFVGAMWNTPYAVVAVRLSRHTHEFLENSDSFTLCAFPKEYRKDLDLLGSVSGRDRDKIAESSLHPIAAQKVASPSYEEATLSIECRVTYRNEIHEAGFRDPSLMRHYQGEEFHAMYYGEIVAVQDDAG